MRRAAGRARGLTRRPRRVATLGLHGAGLGAPPAGALGPRDGEDPSAGCGGRWLGPSRPPTTRASRADPRRGRQPPRPGHGPYVVAAPARARSPEGGSTANGMACGPAILRGWPTARAARLRSTIFNWSPSRYISACHSWRSCRPACRRFPSRMSATHVPSLAGTPGSPSGSRRNPWSRSRRPCP